MKIAIFSDTFAPQVNGVANMAYNSALALSKLGHSINVYTTSGKSSEELRTLVQGKFNIMTIPSCPLPVYKGERLSIPLGFTLKNVSRFKPDVIHVHTPFAVGIEAVLCSRVYKIPIVGTHHTFFDHYLKHIYLDYGWMRKFSWKMTVIFYNFCDRIISPSKSLGLELQNNGLRKPLTVLPNTVNLDIFNSPTNLEVRKKIKDKFKISGKSIVYMGRLSYEKSIDEVIKMFKEVLKKLPDTKLFIIGDGPEKEKLEKLTLELDMENNVVFTGFLYGNDLVEALSASDLYITTSKSENMPLAVLEAEAVGLPIIAISSLGMSEIVVDNENGFLLSQDKPEEVLEKTLDLLTDDNKLDRFSRASRKLSLQYSEEEVTKKLVSIYQELINLKK